MTLDTQDRFLILGGGLMGLALAHELARNGQQVEILSRRRSEAAGFVAAGMLAPHAEGLDFPLLNFGQSSQKLIPEWVKKIEHDSQINCGLRQSGTIVPFLNIEELKKYSTQSFGIKLHRLELEREIPGIAPQWKTALLFEQDGQIDNRRQLMRALEKACVGLGVEFQEGVEVIQLIRNEECMTGVKIRTAAGEMKNLTRKRAILCSGAWSKQILNELPIFPVKGQMLSLQSPKNALKRILFGPGTYLVPREDGLVVVGATSEKNAGFDEGLTPIGQRELQEGINSLLPLASKWPPMERWWGFRPGTPDQLPIIGKSPIKGLWLATGHYRNGVLLAAITSQLLAKNILDQKITKDEFNLFSHFHWNRFQTSRFNSPFLI